MQSRLDKKLAQFLRRRRGNATFDAFASKLGLSKSTLYRLENGEQSATLSCLNQILDRLKCSLDDVFGGD